jgi:hypothetical protein
MEYNDLKKTAFWKNLWDGFSTIAGVASGLIGKNIVTMSSQGMLISSQTLGYIFYGIGFLLFGYGVFRFVYRINKMEGYLIKGIQIIEMNRKKILETEVYSLIPYFENQYRELCKSLSETQNIPFTVEVSILKKHVKSEIMKIAKNTTGEEIEKIVDNFYAPQERVPIKTT